MGKLGLRYPPANSVDRESHAARVALLAEDCADIPDDWLDFAAREWAKREPFMPRACEIREMALRHGRSLSRGRALPPPSFEPEPKPDPPPLSEDVIRKLPAALIDLGVSLGEFDRAVVERIRSNATQ